MTKKAKILIVDDEPDMLAIMFIRLKRWGYEAVCAASGAEAFKKVKENKPGLILLDLALPDMQGDKICRKIKSSAETSSVPVVVISAVRENLFARSRDCGADDCLLKPYEPSDLIKKIERFLPRKKNKAHTEDKMKNVQGIKKILPDYREHKKADLKKIGENIKVGDFENIKVLSHKMSGSGAMYGFEKVSRIGAAMEDAASAKNIPELRRLYRELKKRIFALGNKIPAKNKKK